MYNGRSKLNYLHRLLSDVSSESLSFPTSYRHFHCPYCTVRLLWRVWMWQLRSWPALVSYRQENLRIIRFMWQDAQHLCE